MDLPKQKPEPKETKQEATALAKSQENGILIPLLVTTVGHYS
jgi:hypothetical protein